jgi:hypothetical protein
MHVLGCHSKHIVPNLMSLSNIVEKIPCHYFKNDFGYHVDVDMYKELYTYMPYNATGPYDILFRLSDDALLKISQHPRNFKLLKELDII